MSEEREENREAALAAECAVLGAVLIRPSAFADLAMALKSGDFVKPVHRAIFDAMSALVHRGGVIDVITLGDELESHGERLALDGGPAYLVALANGVPTAENVRHYADIVVKKSAERRVDTLCAALPAAQRSDPETAQQMILELQTASTEAVRGRSRPDSDIADLSVEMREEFVRREANRGLIVGLTTGLKSLDYKTSGLRPGSFNVVAAHTGMGKTALVGQIANHLALDHGVPVYFFSLEQRPLELTERTYANRGQIDQRRLERAEFDVETWKKINATGMQLESRHGLLSISRSDRLGDILTESRAFRVRNHGRPALIVVDYIQLVSTGIRNRSREQEVSEACKALKRLAMELDLAVVCPAQLNRRAEADGARAKLSDLRESGAIGNDADLVLFIEGERGSSEARLRIMKNRHGPVDEEGIHIDFHGPMFRFAEA